MRRAQNLIAAKQWDEAAAVLDQAIDQFPDTAHPWWRQVFHIDCAAAQTDEVYRRLIKLRPTDRGVHLGRCHYLASHGRWSEVADLLEMMIALDTTDYLFLYDAAPVYLQLQDETNYRRICKELLNRFGETNDWVTAERIATTCFLAPSTVDDLESPLQLAKNAVRYENLQSPYAYLAKALGSYRKGDFRIAIDDAMASRSPHTPDPYLDAMSLLVQAMAEYKLGQAEDAQRSFAAVKQWEEHMPKRANGKLNQDWPEWLRYQILRGEAAALIGATAE